MKFKIYLALTVLIYVLSSCSETKKKSTHDLIQLKYDEDYTPTYYEVIEMYTKLADFYPVADLLEYGKTDIGKPLHLFVISSDGDFDAASIRKKNKRIVMINNGIHPGEPCGIDASLQFADDILRNKESLADVLVNTVICIIPVYNIGGCLDRSAWHRTGQTSPKKCGYRGNARNLDLNRDFVKMDTENAKSFAGIFHIWKPDVFLDTHTTNGSEHQYAITLITANPVVLPDVLGDFYYNKMIPDLYKKMAEGEYEMIPYVGFFKRKPEQGIANLVSPPRFSTGYVSLFNTLGFLSENHVYKKYSDRVRSAYNFIIALVEFTHENNEVIAEKRAAANEITKNQKEFALTFRLDTNEYKLINFKGYESDMEISLVTGVERFGYDTDRPFQKEIPFYDHALPENFVTSPKMYIIPQAWSEVIERMKLNKINMFRLSKDTALQLEVYYITEHENSSKAYNGHWFHNKVEYTTEQQLIKYYEGDYVILLNQESNKYIVSMLEPKAKDSFFRWNFFDPCLESREYFSSYGFEKNAKRYLQEHPEFNAEFERKRKEDKEFASNHRKQLAYIYYNSEWADKRFNRYPVGRINDDIKLPLYQCKE
ncbi:MAG: hypothetical protein K8S00_02315 [Bacteroidales bacterium]|nr:hypothetical protein [Bacteroidales bacterium]